MKTIEQANEYLTDTYLVWWERELTVEAANPDDAHRPLEKIHDLAASLSHVEKRQVRPDYTLRWDGKVYQIERSAVTAGLRGADVRMEQRPDGSLAVRHGSRYLPVDECVVADKPKPARPAQATKPTKRSREGARGSGWNEDFDLKKSPPMWQAAQSSGIRSTKPNDGLWPSQPSEGSGAQATFALYREMLRTTGRSAGRFLSR